MRHPPYQLRQNKAVDRVLFIEALEALRGCVDYGDYTYYGLGGPFLDDIRLISSHFEFMQSVCIERNLGTHRRQGFHKNSKYLRLVNETVNDYLTHKFDEGDKCIFWLDYTDLSVSRIEEFKRVLELAGSQSIIRVTLNVSRDRQKFESASSVVGGDAGDNIKTDWAKNLSRDFALYLQDPLTYDQMSHREAPGSVQDMIRVAAGQALPAPNGEHFQCMHSCSYVDGNHQMLTVTGIKLDEDDTDQFVSALNAWKFSNTDWERPHEIMLPNLSVKERLHLERHLPAKSDSVRAIKRCLGYCVGRSEKESDEMLKQYRDFHRHFPIYAKIGV